MPELSIQALRAAELAARADVLRCKLALRRTAAPSCSALGLAAIALLAEQSSLASLDAARAAGLLGSLPARRVAASGVCE